MEGGAGWEGRPAFVLKVRHYEADAYGQVNHANYVHYLEVARLEALEALGISVQEMRRQGYLIVATDLSVGFHAPALSGEVLELPLGRAAMSLDGQRAPAPTAVRTIPAGVLCLCVCGIPPIQDHLDVLSILQNLEKLVVQAGPALTHHEYRLPILCQLFSTACADRLRDFRIIQGFFHPEIFPAPRTDLSQGLLLYTSTFE